MVSIVLNVLCMLKCVDLKKEYVNVKRCTLIIETGIEILDNIILKEKHK